MWVLRYLPRYVPSASITAAAPPRRSFATGLPAVRTERRVRRPRPPHETARMTAPPTIERATEAAVQAAHEETLPTPVALERGRRATVVGILGLFGFLGI